MKLSNPILLPSPMQEGEGHILPPFPFPRPGSKPLEEEEEEETMMMSDDGSGEKRREEEGEKKQARGYNSTRAPSALYTKVRGCLGNIVQTSTPTRTRPSSFGRPCSRLKAQSRAVEEEERREDKYEGRRSFSSSSWSYRPTDRGCTHTHTKLRVFATRDRKNTRPSVVCVCGRRRRTPKKEGGVPEKKPSKSRLCQGRVFRNFYFLLSSPPPPLLRVEEGAKMRSCF